MIRDDHNITGGNKSGFSDSGIFDAELLEVACQTKADSTGNTADDQSLFVSGMLDTVPSDEPTKLLAFVAAVSAEFLRPEMRISGISTTDPSRERTALNVNPPTYSIPTL